MFDLGLRQQYKPSMTAVQVTWTHMYAQTEGWDCNWVYILKYKTHFQWICSLCICKICFKLCFYSFVCTGERSILCSLCNQKSVKLVVVERFRCISCRGCSTTTTGTFTVTSSSRTLHPACMRHPGSWPPSPHSTPSALSPESLVSLEEMGWFQEMYIEFWTRTQTMEDNRFFCLIVNITTPTGARSKCFLISYTGKVGRWTMLVGTLSPPGHSSVCLRACVCVRACIVAELWPFDIPQHVRLQNSTPIS